MAVSSLESPAGDATGIERLPVAPCWLWGGFWLLMVTVAIGDTLHSRAIRIWEPILWEGSSALVATFWLWLMLRERRRHTQHLDQPLRWFALHLRWLPLVAVTEERALRQPHRHSKRSA